MISRRQFCSIAAATTATGFVTAHAHFGPPSGTTKFRVTKLRDGIWVFAEGDRTAKNSGVAMLIATKDGPVLIDTKFIVMADQFPDIVRKQAGAMPRVVINTHHHPDHVGGNFVFKNRAEIIGHVNLKPRLSNLLEQRLRPALRTKARGFQRQGREDEAQSLLAHAEQLTVADFAPDREFEQELELDHGGVKLIIRWFGNAHTDNDIAIFLPNENIVHMGDLLFHRMHAFIDRSALATTAGWQKALDLAKPYLDTETIVVAGHGDVTDLTGLQLQRDYFDQLRNVVESAITEGMSREQITRLQPAVFRSLGNKQLQGKCFGAMYDELKAEG